MNDTMKGPEGENTGELAMSRRNFLGLGAAAIALAGCGEKVKQQLADAITPEAEPIMVSINSWEDAQKELDALFPEGKATPDAQDAFENLKAGTAFENSPADSDPRSESFGALAPLHNEIMSYAANDIAKAEAFMIAVQIFSRNQVQGA